MSVIACHRRVTRRTPRHWVDDLDVGDLVQFKSGVVRTVISVSKRPDGRLFAAALPILHCSWTHAALTYVDRWFMRTYGNLHVGWVDVKRYPMMRKLLTNLHASKQTRTMTCCDVIGVVE